jgi:predicted naringenin-chalcone synthase
MALHIDGMGTALPLHGISQQKACAIAQQGLTDRQSRLLATIYRKSAITRRHTVLLDQEDGTTPFYDLAGTNEGPGTQQRMDRFAREAIPLAVQAAGKALANANCPADAVTHVITVSCTGFFSPGIDREMIEALQLPRSVNRTNIGFMGCHAALNGLQVALAIATAQANATVLLCATELCSLHFQQRWDEQNVLPNALFADGSAAVVAGAAKKGDTWVCKATGSYLLPDSSADMTWQIGDHGFRMTLSRRVPSLIAGSLKAWLQHWLSASGMTIADIGSWAVHPGGPGILDAVGLSLELPPSALNISRGILAEHGNMSSPTILFILDRLREQRAPLPCVMLAFGPGLVIEAALLV